MRIIILGGFLGSGKTSTILRVAREITDNRKQTVAIIENEIGQKGVDDQLLVENGLQVRPLFGGCVCCQITGDLIAAINEITATINPDWLLIEMTGLAVPGNVAKIIRQHAAGRFPCRTVTIIDASRWPILRQALESLVLSQIKDSDFCIINKIDLAGEIVGQVIQDVEAIAGKIPIMTACLSQGLSGAAMEEVFHFE